MGKRLPQMPLRHQKNNFARLPGQVKRTPNFERLEDRRVMAAAPELFSDINTGTLHSNPYGFTELAGEVYFFATNEASANNYSPQPEPLPLPVHDPQPQDWFPGFGPVLDIDLWKTDGTAAGTVRVKDLPPSRDYPDQLTQAGAALYFAAFDEAVGKELWTSDGTAAGTTLLADIMPGKRSSDLWNITAVEDRMFFIAADNAHGRELWTSDGTAAGTINVSDFAFGPLSFKVSTTRAYFIADDGVHGSELWSSDGTQAGTALVKDLRPGAAGGGIVLLPAVGPTLYFRSYGFDGRQTLWKTDGSEAGTTAVIEDFVPDGGDYTSFANHLYFTRWTQAGDELWRTDGTGNGTMAVQRPSTGVVSRIRTLTVVGDRLFFLKGEANLPATLWVTDGSPGTAKPVRGFEGYILERFIGTTDRLFFSAYQFADRRYELWASDGTAAGTKLLRPFDAPTNDGFGWRMTAVGDALYFTPDDGRNGVEAWISHGTPETTRLVADVNQDSASSRPNGFVQAGNQLFFFATDPRFGLSIYRTDGSASGIRRLGVASSSGAVALGRRLVYLGPRHSSGSLWIADGTTEGTVPLDTLHASGPLNSIGHLTRVGDYVYFTGGNGSIDGLWRTDGTTEGTVLVRAGLSPKRLIAAGDLVFFLSRGEADYDLWVSDGTQDGTRLLQAKAPGTPGSSPFFGAYVQPGSMIALGRRLLISRHSAEHGEELWISDGTPEGTRLLKDLVPGLAGSSPRLMTRVGDTVYFVAGGWTSGFELEAPPSDIGLWKTDGTAGGTRLVKSFTSWSGPNHLTAVGDQLFFVGGDAQSGYGLWRTDGTQRGTRLLLDWELSPVIVFPTDGETFLGPKIGWLTDVRGELYFQFDDGRHGPELWRSDGSAAGTWMVTDQRPGPQGAAPTNLTPFKGHLYYTASDEAVGVELFSIDVIGISRTITGSARSEIWNVIRRGDRIEVRSGGKRIFAAPLDSISELVLNTGGGNDIIIVDARDQEPGVRLRIDAGRGHNTLWIKSGTVTASGDAQGGRLRVIVAPGATVIPSGLNADLPGFPRNGRRLYDLADIFAREVNWDRPRSPRLAGLPLIDWLRTVS